jgi:flagellar basal-body rod modification protein FlgD
MITATSNTGSSGSQIKSSKMQLQTSDFIKMMITQLQNQDPMEPTKNEQLLAQMSQIGQLQSSTSLQESLKGLVLQNQIGSSGNLIGKMIQGMDDNNENVEGLVTSVRVQDDNVYLELDNGKSLPLTNVTSIAPSTTAVSTGS